MEMTFITIHNLSPEANILYASRSISDILGYNPEDVVGRSCFDYFHPDEVPFARNIHSRGIQLDKAAVLHYARVRGSDGEWVGCECVFTITYQVMVACTSIYKGDAKNNRRAAEAPTVRRMFASSPRDPRYHMLEHLSSKFRAPPQQQFLEPRAALILNRFSHSLTVMYATDAVAEILGVSPAELDGKSFYDCMQENCYPDAEKCLTSAKENDSIAYLRFWYRDPRQGEDENDDAQMRDASASSDSDEDGGVRLNDGRNSENDLVHIKQEEDFSRQNSRDLSEHESTDHTSSRTSSENSSRIARGASRAMFDVAGPSRSSRPALAMQQAAPRRTQVPELREIEAVVSCTSDGLVVVLRRAHQQIPSFANQAAAPAPANGYYAAPWGAPAIRPHVYQPNEQQPFQHGFQAPAIPAGGPPADLVLASIQEVAVFAWSLVGINGNIASYGHGVPRGEAQPPALPIWNPYGVPEPSYYGPENQAALRWAAFEMTKNPQNGRAMVHQQQRQRHPTDERAGNGTQPGMYQQHREADNGFRRELHSHPSMDYQQRPIDYGRQRVSDHSAEMQQPMYGQRDDERYHVSNHNTLPRLPGLSRFGSVETQDSPGEGSIMSHTKSNSTQQSTPPAPSEGSGANRYLWY